MELKQETYNAKEVAQLFGVEKTFVYAAATSGTLPSVKLGAKRVFPKAAIDAILKIGKPLAPSSPFPKKKTAVVEKPLRVKTYVQEGTHEPAVLIADISKETKHTAQGIGLIYRRATGARSVPKTLSPVGRGTRPCCLTCRQLKTLRAFCADRGNRLLSRAPLLRALDRFAAAMPAPASRPAPKAARQLSLPTDPQGAQGTAPARVDAALTRADLEDAVEFVLGRHETELTASDIERIRGIVREEVAAALKQRATITTEIVSAMNKSGRTREIDPSNGVLHRTPAPEKVVVTFPPLDEATRCGKPG